MRPIHALTFALMIALAVIAGAPAHALCFADQNAQGCRPVLLAQYRTPLDFSSSSRPKAACKPFETSQDASNVGAWSALDIIPLHAPVSLEAAQAELERIGGARLVIEVDAKALHKELLERSRDDIRRLLREVRLAATITFRGDTIAVQPTDSANATRILPAIELLTSGSFPQLEVRSVGGERVARGVVSLAVTEQALSERRQISEHATIDIMTRRVQEVGIGISAVQALGGGRILMIIPGLKQPERLWQLMPSMAKLTFQIADSSADPCAATQTPPDSEILTHHTTRTSLLVKRHLVASGQDLAGVAVALDAQTRAPAVAVRFNANATSRLSRATRDNVGQLLAIVLDGELIAASVIREPIADGAVRLSGGLTLLQAKDLATLLRAGTLPSPLTIVERHIVEP